MPAEEGSRSADSMLRRRPGRLESDLRLYYTPGAASQAAHIALCENGLPFKLLKSGSTSDAFPANQRFTALCPVGKPPLLELPGGETLREAPAILGFVADVAPAARLAPTCGTWARSKLGEWLHFLTRCFACQSNYDCPYDAALDVPADLAWIDLQLSTNCYLLGQVYSVADVYLWALWSWRQFGAASRSELHNIDRWHLRIAARSALRRAIESER